MNSVDGKFRHSQGFQKGHIVRWQAVSGVMQTHFLIGIVTKYIRQRILCLRPRVSAFRRKLMESANGAGYSSTIDAGRTK